MKETCISNKTLARVFLVLNHPPTENLNVHKIWPSRNSYTR